MTTIAPGPAVDFRNSVARYAKRPKHQASGRLPYHLSPEMAGLFDRIPSLRILDVGCGPAQNRDYFTTRGHSYVGLDLFAPEADVRADATALPFVAGSFDAIITIATLHLVLDPLQYLREARRVLRPGGTLTGTVAFLEPWTYGGLIQLTPAGLAGLLRLAGFRIEYIWPGWQADMALQLCAFRPLRMVGHLAGRLQYAVHAAWWTAMNVARKLSLRPTRQSIIQQLEFAGSLNFHAIKDDDCGHSA